MSGFLSLLVAIGLAIATGLLLLIRRLKPGVWRSVAAIPLAVMAGYGAFLIVGATTYEVTDTFGLNFNESLEVLIGIVGGVSSFALFLYFGLRGGPGATRASAPRPRPAKQAPATPAPRGAPDIFISYKREERREVGEIARRLEALGLTVWFDAELRSGTSFDAEIDRNVRAAKCVLVCWSPGAVASEWVRGEATIGRQRGVLAAAILKPCDLPAPFNLIHAEDLTAGTGPENPAWLALAERIGALLGRPGLAPFEAMGEATDRGAIADWLRDHADDPLFDRAVAMLRSA